ncbi:HNH endonuclease [Dendrosporobacter sp. 1207_IL3150]|uniref:HNH endonuclease n=1 Tax=Dendrosporobacter sp. 1207_IL3150 TaxID=3084054 RepID=UPI002FDA63E1
MYTKLTDVQIKLAEQLLISVIKKENIIYYHELAERINPPIFHRNVGKQIGEVSTLCHELGLPLLSAKVVNKDTNTAGAGFYPLYEMYGIDTQGLSEKELFKLELKKIRECKEWYKLADHLGLNLDLPRSNNEIVEEFEIQIRILPMSKDEEFPGWSFEEIQKKYFLKDLVEKNGYYYYRKSGMNCAKGSLVLFQFNNAIIAAARIIDIVKYAPPVDEHYHGAYIFDTNSVTIFEPITYEELYVIDNSIQPFKQVKQIMRYELLEKVQRLIARKQHPLMAEELPSDKVNQYIEGAKKQITVNAYERSYKARQECIKHKGDTCLICGFNFGDFYGEEFKGKIHVHHIKSLAEVKGEYQIDPLNDLIPVCPNCHLALHSKGNNEAYSIEELKAMLPSRS